VKAAERRHEAVRVKAAERRREAVRVKAAARYEAHIQAMVDAMPPPTPEQIAALTAIFDYTPPVRVAGDTE
jgi:hypothetical protein